MKFAKIFKIFFIFIVIFFLFFAAPSISANNNPAPAYQYVPEGAYEPAYQYIANSGSSGIPQAQFELNITSETKKPFRDTDVYLNITLINKEPSILKINFINIDLGKMYNTTTHENKIRISRFEIDKQKSFRYSIHIPKNADRKNPHLISHSQFNNLEDIISIKNHHISKESLYLNDDIDIQNNLPVIDSAKIILNSLHSIRLDESDTLYLVGNLSDPIEAWFNISACDKEDGNNLDFAGFISIDNNSINNNRIRGDAFNSIGNFSTYISNIESGKKYSLEVMVRDQDKDISTTTAHIYYNYRYYDNFSVPSAHFYEMAAIVFTIMSTVIITLIIYIRLSSWKNQIITARRAILIVLALWGVYIISLQVVPQKIPYLNDYIFFNTLPIFELVIYLTIFIIINYFTESCFSLDDEKNLQKVALWLNYLSTVIILYFFIDIFPLSSNISNILPDYYMTIATVLGTIFALIVTLSGQFPKNIFTVSTMCADPNRCMDPSDELFSYPKKMQYFVALYGATLCISILGLVAGTQIQFSTLIMEPLDGDLVNLISLAIFEITFLLIPPTVISLYHLMQVISFRGKITINSKPSGAEVYLSRRYEKKETLLGGESRLYLLKLFTPCTLMLMNGTYILKLKYNDHEIVQNIEVRDAVENKYLFELLNLEKEYDLSTYQEDQNKSVLYKNQHQKL